MFINVMFTIEHISKRSLVFNYKIAAFLHVVNLLEFTALYAQEKYPFTFVCGRRNLLLKYHQ